MISGSGGALGPMGSHPTRAPTAISGIAMLQPRRRTSTASPTASVAENARVTKVSFMWLAL